MADLDEMEDATRPLIERTLSGVMGEIIARYEADDIAALPPDGREQVEDMLRETYATAMRMGGQPMIEGMKDCFPHLQTKQEEDSLFPSHDRCGR